MAIDEAHEKQKTVVRDDGELSASPSVPMLCRGGWSAEQRWPVSLMTSTYETIVQCAYLP